MNKSFLSGFEKQASFFGRKKTEVEKEYSLSKEHVAQLMPHFHKSEKARKALKAGKLSDGDFGDQSQDFINAVTKLEMETKIPNDQIYKHMYKHHSKF